ncbi:transcription elongation factor [Pseudolabrys sp. Root1462]|uniref:transcription elongation factor GreA n=1 Tax=Pseudolabrys sp. Root1462 TaxID=1736466 RepID=UPI000702CF5B|nr:transcription elongation factor GreA [Pseudolabrys sp. Root1462]KQZ01148.1 transcription elongation factor [Pseudolabrys sp. Root1462]
MSRAFVNEDNTTEDLPDRPVSTHVNYVTPHGLALIEAAFESARQAYNEAQASGERDALARAARELRYWSARRASAQVIAPGADTDTVQFGSTVTIEREDGRRQIFTIVGEDEAEPAKGSVSHVSPLAVALLGKRVGDVVRAGRDDAEIVAIG